MAIITSAVLKPSPIPNSNNQWDLQVDYVAEFSCAEVKSKAQFREGFEVWEEDDTSADDLVVPEVVGVGTFVATNTTMPRTLHHTIDGTLLDTELGAEEVYAKVRLRHLDVKGKPLATGQTQTLPTPIAP